MVKRGAVSLWVRRYSVEYEESPRYQTILTKKSQSQWVALVLQVVGRPDEVSPKFAAWTINKRSQKAQPRGGQLLYGYRVIKPDLFYQSWY